MTRAEQNARDLMLIRRARAGDRSAEATLVELYSDMARVMAIGYWYPGAQTEDVVQEALMGLLKAIRSFDPSILSPFVPFAKLCISRNIVTGLKTAQRGKHRALTTAARTAVAEDADGSDNLSILDVLESPYYRNPATVVADRETLAELAEKMRGLSPLERRAVIGFANGLTYNEICSDSDGDHKQIDNALSRARRKFAA